MACCTRAACLTSLHDLRAAAGAVLIMSSGQGGSRESWAWTPLIFALDVPLIIAFTVVRYSSPPHSAD